MRYLLVLFTVLTPLLIAAPVAAQTQEDQSSGAKPLTRIEADSESHEIRFYIDGALAAVLKNDGLHVRKSMAYGGTLTDYGQKGFEDFTGDADSVPDVGKDGRDAQ